MTLIDNRRTDNIYAQTMGWITVAFSMALLGALIIGPQIPPAMTLPISLVVIAVLTLSGFVRALMTETFAKVLVFLVPTAMGAITWPLIEQYTKTGNGDIVVNALIGTVLVFGSVALLGWFSSFSIESWANKLMLIVFGIIGISLLNVFLFKMPMISLLMSVVALIVFSLYSFIDIQRIRDGRFGSPARAAVSVFLDVFNIFTSLLNILGFLSK